MCVDMAVTDNTSFEDKRNTWCLCVTLDLVFIFILFLWLSFFTRDPCFQSRLQLDWPIYESDNLLALKPLSFCTKKASSTSAHWKKGVSLGL